MHYRTLHFIPGFGFPKMLFYFSHLISNYRDKIYTPAYFRDVLPHHFVFSLLYIISIVLYLSINGLVVKSFRIPTLKRIYLYLPWLTQAGPAWSCFTSHLTGDKSIMMCNVECDLYFPACIHSCINPSLYNLWKI